MMRWIALVAAASLLCAAPQRSKKPEREITQTLEVLPDPPAVIKADTARLVFHVSPLSGKGLLSQQVRDGIRAIWRINNKAVIVRLRALVAGTGDMRRVQSIVSEMFSEKRLPLPVVNVVQVGVLPMEGAQVIIEATSVTRKPVNPHGLAFISGQGASAPINPDQPSTPVTGLTAQSLASLRHALNGVGSTSADVTRVTCFTSSLEDYADVRRIVATEFPNAALAIAQAERAPVAALVECEAVARLRKAPAAGLQMLNPPGLTASPNFSQVAVVGPRQIALTGTQLAFRFQDSDVRLAFDRLKSSLEQAGLSMRDVAMSNIYPLTGAIQQKVRSIRFEFYDKSRPPASTMILFQGLPSLDASFGVDVIAVVPDSR
ncbi:MAG: hypothetical protein JJE04_03510 [Acidobacteriia bacterium]|nr:hypothetical protein [Terriglobia bacterium]